jgi:hypothetical protein
MGNQLSATIDPNQRLMSLQRWYDLTETSNLGRATSKASPRHFTGILGGVGLEPAGSGRRHDPESASALRLRFN